jgi:hypothetical protein
MPIDDLPMGLKLIPMRFVDAHTMPATFQIAQHWHRHVGSMVCNVCNVEWVDGTARSAGRAHLEIGRWVEAEETAHGYKDALERNTW